MNEYPGYKCAFIDTETTGLDRHNHNIFQLSGIITDPDLNVLEKFNFKFQPFDIDNFEQEAIDRTGVNKEDLRNLEMIAPEAYQEFIKVLSRHCNKYDKTDKLQMIAYNSVFDSDFLREFFIKNGDNYYGSYFWNPAICVYQASAWFAMRVRGAFTNFKLKTLCVSAGIKWDDDKAHDAMYDVEQTLELFKYIKEYVPSL